MSDIKITKEMVDNYLQLHNLLYDKANEIRKLLHEIDPENYKKSISAPMQYYNPSENYLDWGGWDGCMGCYDWEEDSIPTKYLYDEDWIQKVNEQVRIAQEKKQQEKLLEEEKQKEIQEKRDRTEYERLKKKFNE
jgi:hypothetical protein